MKKLILTLAAVATAASVFGQGQVNFNNRVTQVGTTPNPGGFVNSPIFGPEPGDATLRKSGGTSTGNPAGTTVYNGPRLLGTGFTAQLWYAPGAGASESALIPVQVNGTTTFRTVTTLSGYLQPVISTMTGYTGGPTTFQVRVWDNMGGTVLSWDAALARGTEVAHGKSNLFTPPDVTQAPNPPPNLAGLESFNIAIVPEPSTIALGILGGLGTLVLLRRRK